MKKAASLLILVVVLSSLLLVQTPGLSFAQGQITPMPTPYPGEADFITFGMLGLQDEVLLGPYSNSFIRFSTPDSWFLQPGAKLRLSLETIVNTSRVFAEGADDYSGALMEVTLNGQVIETVFLRKGVQEIEIEIPQAALIPRREDGRHSLQLFLDATIDCLFEHETAVIVRSISGVTLPYKPVSPSLDLTLMPRPLFKPDSLLPKESIIVIPDQPTGKELQGAMTVAATLGRMSTGLQKVLLVNESSLTDLQRANANLIAVGKRAEISLLGVVTFPTSSFDPTAQQSDGVVQMGVSPWNLENVILYIGGAEDDGVVKAAQAFSSGVLRVGANPSFSVISNVADAVQVEDVATERTFAMLGYPTRTMSGVGFQSLEYNFSVPLGKVPSAESSLALTYNHSAVFDLDTSSAVLFINDEPFSSIRFTQESASSTTTLEVDIPDYSLLPGRNTVIIQTEFIPTDYCSTLDDSGLWMTISDESVLRLPLIDAESSSVVEPLDLGVYPYPFVNNPTLGDLSFVFPDNDPLSWSLGASIAADLGQYAAGTTIELKAANSNDLTAEDRDNSNLILVGRASQLSLVEELNDTLPAPFNPGSDVTNEEGAQISYRIPSGTDLGYLELIQAPWNSTRSVLGVFGSTSEGLGWAGNALTNPALRSQMRGDYVVVSGQKLYAVDTNLGLGTQNLSATAAPGIYPTLIPDEEPITTYAYKQNWVVTAIVITSVAIAILLIVLFLFSLRKKKLGD